MVPADDGCHEVGRERLKNCLSFANRFGTCLRSHLTSPTSLRDQPPPSSDHPPGRTSSMAQTQDLSVSRAVFITALLRQDAGAADIARDDATLFARAILRTCNICTSANIKVCGGETFSKHA